MSTVAIHNPKAPQIDALLREKREDILRVAAAHGATNVRVFGSVARGEADEKSDIDLLVEMRPEHSLLDRASLWVELEDLLKCKIDIATERVLKPRMKEQVIRESVLL